MAKIPSPGKTAKIDPPPFFDLLMEGPRTLLAIMAFLPHFAEARGGARKPSTSRNNSEAPIVVVPGFGAPNVTTLGLRNYFERAGHATYTPDIVINHGGRSVLRATEDAIKQASDDSGVRAVAVGHSLGGVVCLLAAYRQAELGRVITMGSPLRTAMGEEGANTLLRVVHSSLSLFEDWAGVARELHEHMRAGPPPVPLTTIRAKGDGIVAWGAAAHPWSRLNHDVSGSHCGLVANPEAAERIMSLLPGSRRTAHKSRTHVNELHAA